MSESASRRNFLFGRSQAFEDDWLMFLSRLRRACQGRVSPLSGREGRLVPERLDDVLQARGLCLAHGVCLALEGLPLPVRDQARRVLWVQAGTAWGSLVPLGDTGQWRVEAGCQLAAMQAAGLLGEPARGSVENLAQWLAVVGRHEPILDRLGLVSVEWLFADGTIEVLGAFGSAHGQPLRSLKAQQTVPKLFELSAEPSVREALESQYWPGVFRLDALRRTDEVNLANVVLGSGGALGWLVAATFAQSAVRALSGDDKGVKNGNKAGGGEAAGGRDAILWSTLDQRLKGIMDPEQLFMSPPI